MVVYLTLWVMYTHFRRADETHAICYLASSSLMARQADRHSTYISKLKTHTFYPEALNPKLNTLEAQTPKPKPKTPPQLRCWPAEGLLPLTPRQECEQSASSRKYPVVWGFIVEARKLEHGFRSISARMPYILP